MVQHSYWLGNLVWTAVTVLQLLSPYIYSCVLILFCPHGKSWGSLVTCFRLGGMCCGWGLKLKQFAWSNHSLNWTCVNTFTEWMLCALTPALMSFRLKKKNQRSWDIFDSATFRHSRGTISRWAHIIILHRSLCWGCDHVQNKLSACHTASSFISNQWLIDISSTMLSVGLLVLSLFHVSLAGSQPTQSSQQAPGPPHPAGEQPPLAADNLSFPWSRLRLPRYPSHFFKNLEIDKNVEGLPLLSCWFSSS